MLEGLLHLFAFRPWQEVMIDLADIAIVTYVVYRALLVLRGTRAMQMGTGLGVILLVYVVAKWAGLATLFNLLSTLLSSLILIVVVVFQNDIRRGLMRVGSRAFFGGITRAQESRVIDEVVGAATELARHRMGALICFEQDANLDEFVVSQGTPIDAAVHRELLVGLFIPESVNKLHDGAVVIRNLRIAKAGVFFPMPEARLDKSLGSRHRAALGITEETDAVVVVVSEERGVISFCFNGNIISNLDGPSLRQALLGLFGQRARNKKKTAGPLKRASQTGSFRVVLSPTSSANQTGSFAIPASERLGERPSPREDERANEGSYRERQREREERERARSARDRDREKEGESRWVREPAALTPRPIPPAAPIETPKPNDPRSSRPPPPREPGEG